MVEGGIELVRLIKFWNRGKDGYCNRCGSKLTEEELQYYEIHCEKCEDYVYRKLNKEDFRR